MDFSPQMILLLAALWWTFYVAERAEGDQRLILVTAMFGALAELVQ